MKTATQKIIDLLKDADSYYSPDEIARLLGIDRHMVIKALDHINFAIRRKGMRLEILPQRCKKCGYVFEPSTHVASKCPRCHSQWLEPPRFRIRVMKKH
ncbi:MAG: transcriptional regulator [Candidatus Diapherotrites archaeon]|nr:transcriptional regulator [Candidatus Diapherotrites archaeon]